MKNNFCFPTQSYDVFSVKVCKRCVFTLVAELDGIRSRRRNYDHVIMFQMFIIQYVQLVTVTKTFAHKLMLDSTRVTADVFMNSYVTPTPRLQNNWGCFVGIKVMSSIAVQSLTLL